MIYLLILIPICFLIVMFFKQIKPNYSNKLHFFVGSVICWIVCLLTILTVDKIFYWNKVKDVEWLTSYVTYSEYFESWNERVSCRHPIYETKTRRISHTSTTGSGKNKSTSTYYTTESYRVIVGHYHAYDVDEHPERFYFNTNVNKGFDVSREDYSKVRALWSNEKLVDLNRSFHTKDGNKYVSFYDNNIDHTINLAIEHGYENKVRVSNSIYTYQKVDSNDLKKVHEYPKLGSQFVSFDNFPYIISKDKSLSNINYANQLLQSHNSLQGVSKQIKYWLCLYADAPVEVAFIQEAKWEGGNKNEFTTCIGYDSKTKKVNWVKSFCWDNEILKQTVKDSLNNGDSLNLVKAVKVITSNGKKLFIRKPFAEFNYLNVSHINWWEVFTIFWIMFVVCFAFFFINLKMEE